MAAWIPKTVIQAAKSQNAYVGICAVRSRDYSSKPYIIKNPTTASLKRGTGGRSSFNGVVCTIFGCNGFVGPYVCNRLGKLGTQLILSHRCDPYHVLPLKLCGDLGQVLFHPLHLRDEESIIKSMKYSNVVINLIGAKLPTKNFSYYDVHVDGARRLARLAKQCNVERFIHVSCLNASENPKPLMLEKGSEILKTKWQGECAVREEFPEATIIRPSTIYGQEDNFIRHYMNPFRRSLKTIPLWEKGEKTVKQPLWVGDVAAGITAAVMNRESIGKTYQFVGPTRYKLHDLVQWMFDIISGGNRSYYMIINLKYNPVFKMKVNFNELIYSRYPYLALSWDILEADHTTDEVDPKLPTLEDLGVTPCTMESRIDWELLPWKYDNNTLPVLAAYPPPIPENLSMK